MSARNITPLPSVRGPCSQELTNRAPKQCSLARVYERPLSSFTCCFSGKSCGELAGKNLDIKLYLIKVCLLYWVRALFLNLENDANGFKGECQCGKMMQSSCFQQTGENESLPVFLHPNTKYITGPL